MDNKFFILDAYALIFRSYYAFIKNPRYNSKGLNTSAIYGFTTVLEDLIQKEKPSHIAVCFDAPAPSFRKEIYPEYKANRDATPEDIKKSIPFIKEILNAYNIPIFEQIGYEADDLAGSLAKKFSNGKFSIFLMTSDKDYLQLIDDNISVYKPRTQKKSTEIIDLKTFKNIYKLQTPFQYTDVLALAGDTADNIPGIPGIGEKTALKLLQKYQSIENIYNNIDKLTPKLREKLIENKDNLELSKKLVIIKTDIPIDTNEEKIKLSKPNVQSLEKIFKELEFKRTADRIIGQYKQNTIFSFDNTSGKKENKYLKTIKDIQPDYQLIETHYEIDLLLKEIANSNEFAIDTETTSIDPVRAKIIGISFATARNKAYFLHLKDNPNLLDNFKDILADDKKTIIGQNLKYDIIVLKKYGINIKGKLFDTLIAHHLLSPELKHNIDYLAETYLNYKTIHIDELIGKKGQKQRNMADLTAEKIKDYAAEDADIALQLKQTFAKKLQEQNLTEIFTKIEMPLIPVLAQMELNGILLNVEFLKKYKKQLSEKILKIQEKIYKLAGTEFNISSTKQLGEILFKKLKISDKPKLTKTKQYATDEAELLKYKTQHPIINLILEYRSLKKLITTYVDALPKLINPKTQRLHTSFNQAITVTGRLSSNNPNLQNIPIRTAEGREIRKAFIPPEGFLYVDADYSQVELRLMAHLSQDPTMLEAFRNGIDIHTQTAAKIFNVPLEQVTKEMRYQAKTANFAMIYGSSAFGLAQNLNISRQEAKKLIDNYFATYPKVKEYMDKMIAEARKKEYVTTLMGRKRYLHDINSRNSLLRSNAEHNAINTPIQGSAADIIKLAMIKINEIIIEQKINAKILLQVHDELLFEVIETEKEKLKKIVKHEMEHTVNLSVPLIVDLSEGKNWADAH